MATRRGSKPSVFTAFNQLRVAEDVDSDDGSAEERQMERQEKQKQKKKSRSKKKNSDSAQLKDLAFVSVSKPKKTKSKKKEPAPAPAPTTASPTALPVNEPRIASGDSDEKKQEAEAEAGRPLEPVIQTPAVPNGTKKKKPPSVSQQQQKKKTASPREQQPLSQPPQQVPPAVVSPIACPPQSSSETELGAVYTPSHITITRVDGQMKRTVAVTDVMDQLLRYTQQNSQLLIVQDQLGHANRSLQDQLLRRDEIITGLQHEVTMFRQMCLNLQAEVSLLRSTVAVAPTLGSNANAPPPHRPPPGMS